MYVNTIAAVVVPLVYTADAPLFSVRAPFAVTTASSQVTVIACVSPTPSAVSPASATDTKSGASPSIDTAPRSPAAAPAAPHLRRRLRLPYLRQLRRRQDQ